MFLNDLGICCEIAFNGTIGLIREQVMSAMMIGVLKIFSAVSVFCCTRLEIL